MPRIDKHLVLSTAHVSRLVADAFEGSDTPDWLQCVMVHGTEFGWWIYVLSPDNSDVWTDLPPCLRASFELATSHDCNWILFDCDEGAIDELEEFNW